MYEKQTELFPELSQELPQDTESTSAKDNLSQKTPLPLKDDIQVQSD